MKHLRRLALLTLCTLLLMLPLTACESTNWKDDLTAASLTATVKSSLPAGDGWETVSDDYVSPSAWGEDYADYLEKVTEYRILVSENSDMNIDEVGIFRCKSEKDAKAVGQFAENYLATKKLQLAPQLESYNPAELPKLDYATVNVMGCYVLYTILDSANTTAAGSALEKALTPAA